MIATICLKGAPKVQKMLLGVVQGERYQAVPKVSDKRDGSLRPIVRG